LTFLPQFWTIAVVSKFQSKIKMNQIRLSKRFRSEVGLSWLVFIIFGLLNSQSLQGQQTPVFGEKFKNLESMSTGQWWKVKPNKRRTLNLNVPRNEVVGFAVYTHDHGVLKLSAQFFPLMPDEARLARLELKRPSGEWQEVAKEEVIELGY